MEEPSGAEICCCCAEMLLYCNSVVELDWTGVTKIAASHRQSTPVLNQNIFLMKKFICLTICLMANKLLDFKQSSRG